MSDTQPTAIVTLDGARKVVDAALAEADRRGVRVAVVVTRLAGDPVMLVRMDGVAPLAAETARRKCWSVGLTRRGTRAFGEMLKSEMDAEPELFHGMLRIGDMTAIAGGVPIVVEGEIVGAVGVSGASSDDDHEIAEIAAGALAEGR
jgi:uncharacterized protein GlcG (DUF336 family)